jgi:hypothetical protein
LPTLEVCSTVNWNPPKESSSSPVERFFTLNCTSVSIEYDTLLVQLIIKELRELVTDKNLLLVKGQVYIPELVLNKLRPSLST